MLNFHFATRVGFYARVCILKRFNATFNFAARPETKERQVCLAANGRAVVKSQYEINRFGVRPTRHLKFRKLNFSRRRLFQYRPSTFTLLFFRGEGEARGELCRSCGYILIANLEIWPFWHCRCKYGDALERLIWSSWQ